MQQESNQLRAIHTERLRIEGFQVLLLERHRDALSTCLPEQKTLVLVASLLKLRKQSRACLLLAQEFMVEEILATSRTMAEVAINAAYLQFAGDEELQRFQHFDTQSLYKHSERLRPITSRELSAEQEADLQGIVAEARRITQLSDKAQSWSRTHAGLIARAECVESHMPDSMMPGLVLTAHNLAHRAVHGTGDTLSPFYNALGNGEVPLTPERLEDLQKALSLVVFCLEAYALFCDRFLHQNRQAEILSVSRRSE